MKKYNKKIKPLDYLLFSDTVQRAIAVNARYIVEVIEWTISFDKVCRTIESAIDLANSFLDRNISIGNEPIQLLRDLNEDIQASLDRNYQLHLSLDAQIEVEANLLAAYWPLVKMDHNQGKYGLKEYCQYLNMFESVMQTGSHLKHYKSPIYLDIKNEIELYRIAA